MKTIFKRLSAMLLACLMVLGSVPLSVFAEEAAPSYVATAEELENALANGEDFICITDSFTVDRSFFITKSTTLYSSAKVTLTRGADFAGDFFVVGEDSEGNAADGEEAVVFTLGLPASDTKDLLVLDGNKENLTVEVSGSALFVCGGAKAELHPNVTIQNFKKTANERSLLEKHGMSYTNRIGGAGIILAKSSGVNIFGGIYQNNETQDDLSAGDSETNSFQGGFAYNFGTLNIYGGTFLGNHAARGGFVYNYRTANIFAAEIAENTASDLAGAIYMANSTASFVNLGLENDIVTPKVVFRGNTSEGYAGAIYARNKVVIKNTEFNGNESAAGGGAIAAYTPVMTIDSTTFSKNLAATYGGAIFLSDTNGKEALELTVTNSQFKENESTKFGGAVYAVDSVRIYGENTDFEGNKGSYGAAVYAKTSEIEFNGSKITNNTASYYGGGIALYDSSAATLNKITANGNSGSRGGFLYTEESTLDLYNSHLKGNSSSALGGAIAFYTNATSNVYKTTFEENTATTNGGAFVAYTGGTKTVLHSCQFLNNTAAGMGGVMYASSKALVDLYNTTATGNSADKGGALYITTTGTVVNLAGFKISGNTATTGGPIIWGNSTGAKLYIDKGKYIDLDNTGDWDDAYWAAAIYNALKVYDSTLDIPDYTDYDGSNITTEVETVSANVVSASQLERALKAGLEKICISADFEIDRSFYITRNTTIYSAEKHTLTRAADFLGDFFVIGEDSEGNAVESEEDIVLTLGDPDSQTNDLLILDGNKANITADVAGSAIFVCGGGRADLYPNLTIQNFKKTANERSLLEKHGMSYTDRIGGAGIILAKNSTVNIYGGIYQFNEAQDDLTAGDSATASFQGGFIYNFGKLNIYGGKFYANHAARGAFIYNYRTSNIYAAEILENTASDLGGAIYMANSTASIMNFGEENDLVTPKVVFRGNTSGDHGGAIYARNKLNIKNTEFAANNSAGYGGVIAAYTTVMVIDGASFEGNTASSHGAAIYLTGSNEKDSPELTLLNTVFKTNESAKNGGAVYMSGSARLYGVNNEFHSNKANYGGAVYATASSVELNGAVMTSNSAVNYGGGMALYSAASARLNNITATGNHSVTRGGFLYNEGATLDLYNSTLKNNSSDAMGGALTFYTGAVSNVYKTTFEGNTAASNGGAFVAYTGGTKTVLHSCQFLNNTAAGMGGVMYASGKALVDIYNGTATENHADKGGALYITTTGTVVNLIGFTVSGNTATTGGPIIWGNSTGAKLFIDKEKYTDTDVTGELDSSYWSSAIYNKLTVTDQSGEVPKYLDYGNENYDHMSDAVDVTNSEELEKAILAGHPHIRIVADFEIDRTFFITKKTTVFSTAPYTLTRAPGFAGDIFVVGETSDGKSAILLGSDATLILGNPLSIKENLLTIDGNKDNMTIDVNGTVVFLTQGALAQLYPNVSVINCHKVANDRTYGANYKFSRPNRVGGPVAIVENGVLEFFGGNYKFNSVRDEVTIEGDTTDAGRDSTLGGVFYNNSNVRIYGGTFEGNHAARGGISYNYKIIKITSANFIGNTSSAGGGAFYMPNAAAAHLRIGSETGTGKVLFRENSSDSHGGAIYSSPMCCVNIYGNTTFEGNVAKSSGGAIAVYGQFTANDTSFLGNTAGNRGGAVYATKSDGENTTRHIRFIQSSFENNTGYIGGAISVYASSADYSEGAIVFAEKCDFVGNYAQKNSSGNGAGGAVHVDRQGSFTATDSTFSQNHSDGEAGAIYASYKSKIKLCGGSFNGNFTNAESGSHGGALSIRSSRLDVENTVFDGNTAHGNGGAAYISYVSSTDVNSTVTVLGASFTNNVTDSVGGAFYVTRQTVEEANDTRILSVKDTSFESNSAKSAGAVYLASKVDAYFSGANFTKNTAFDEQGGAIYTASGIVKIENSTFTQNSAKTTGGAISVPGKATLTLFHVTASGNTSGGYGGFLYSENANIKVFGGEYNENTSGTAGGAMAFFGTAVSALYDASFSSNTATTNGGALFLYTESTKTVLHSCSFLGNTAGNYGGAMEMSKVSLVDIYDITAKNNGAKYGGFLYETSAGTTVTLVGATVSGNTATAGGPIIWGNTLNADLYIDKAKFTDLDATTQLDDAYWAAAIANKLTVIETEGSVPEKESYTPEKGDSVVTPGTKKPVPVTDVFNLSQSSSDGHISSVYDKLTKLDSSNNFMSKSTVVYPNINGKDVTVDTFVYPEYGKADNMNVGQGILIFQAMQYKKAHPEEEVYIDASSYRFSIEAAVNINRNSRYFGYMRNLYGMEYDAFGFVRISYLLVSAAKMGIHVNVIGHIDGYPIGTSDPNLSEYFVNFLQDPCDPAYAEGAVIGDYMDFTHCAWPLDNKGGTDMMHTKMCAVSHYLDINGEAHYNAVFSSSSNLDGIRSDAANGNWKLQTGSIVSDHEEIYRASVNYLRLVRDYGKYREGISAFQDVINTMSTEQIDRILEGNEESIPADEKIVYLGGENDPVFELYFTPFGGGVLEWDERYNPYCKYLRKLYDSEGSIIFTWNAAEYSSGFSLGLQMEDMIVEAFHKNRNPENRFFGVMNTFDGSRLSDLTIGKDIGYVSVNERPFGQVHNKDVQVSYVENGQRYYVTLLNSLNLHSGSMYYQSNFLLVVKETECAENGVFFTVAENSTQGIVEHAYGEEKVYYPSETEDGYYYRECTECGKQVIGEKAHHQGEWTVHLASKDGKTGIQKQNCTVCGDLLSTREYTALDGKESITEYKELLGHTFTAEDSSLTRLNVTKTPLTMEALIHIPKSFHGRGGVIVGNYESTDIIIKDNLLNFEIYTGGKPRLYCINDYRYVSCIFDTDIRSDNPCHIAVTVEGNEAKLYVNGVLTDTKEFSLTMPEKVENMVIGSDNRVGNPQHFRGTLYSVSLFEDVRSAEEIKRDAILVSPEEEGLIYNKVYSAQEIGSLYDPDVFGKAFDAQNPVHIEFVKTKPGHTIEASVFVPKDLKGRAGVIVGNYDNGNNDQLSLEVYENGKVRLFYIYKYQRFDHIFSVDVRQDKFVHLALTVENDIATLYVNGEKAEEAKLSLPFPKSLSGFCIGGDRRLNNSQYFKGKIAYVHLFDDVRSLEEIRKDQVLVSGTTEGLLASYYLTEDQVIDNIATPLGQTFSKEGRVFAESTSVPATMEALIHLPKSFHGRGGVIFGSYSENMPNAVNLEVYNQGKIRLFYMNGWIREDHIFATDIRSEDPTHIAVTISGSDATLYVNGEKVEEAKLSLPFPTQLTDLCIGGDNRVGNSQYFKGTIYSAALFTCARTQEEIRSDFSLSMEKDKNYILSGLFVPESEKKAEGKHFTEDNALEIPSLSSTPLTMEAWLQIPTNFNDRAGVLLGNYNGSSDPQLNFEIYYGGRARLFYISNGIRFDHVFSTDIRSKEKVHLAITVDGDLATMYLNGKAMESAKLTVPFIEATEGFKLGGDNRSGNNQYFKGSVYSLALFDDVRSEEEIALDMKAVSVNEESLMYILSAEKDPCPEGNGFEGHTPGEWIQSIEAAVGCSGIWYNSCTSCGKKLSYKTAKAPETYGRPLDYTSMGTKFETYKEIIPIDSVFSEGPKTFEVLFHLSPSYSNRGGVLLGNYTADMRNVINLEIYTGGAPRFYYKVNYVTYNIQFTTDVRSEDKTHLAVTIDGLTANLYVNGVLTESAALTVAVPNITEGFCIGGDARTSNYQNFKGTIYAVNLFSDVRSAEEIRNDAVMVRNEESSLIYSAYLTKNGDKEESFDFSETTIVNFGDSIFGNYKAPEDISSYLAVETGATVYNVGFGGAQMTATSNEKYNAFGMENLANAITTGDFSLQEAYYQREERFIEPFNTLKAIDFNTVDIITIAYGTNDFKNGKSLADVEKALRYSIETIQAKYPNVQIVLCTPVYRFWMDENGNFTEDSDTKEIEGVLLTDYVTLFTEIGNEYSLHVIDNYNGSGINAHTRNEYFSGTDSTHPNEAGRKKIAENMAKELIRRFG